MFISYDPAAAYPQIPQPGRGEIVAGVHTPPPGLVSFEIDPTTLPHQKQAGERWNDVLSSFYDVTEADVLTPKPQAIVDAIRADRLLEKNRRANRQPNSLSALKTAPVLNMVRAGRTQASADAWLTGKSQNLINRIIVMTLSRLVKYLFTTHDDFFDGNE